MANSANIIGKVVALQGQAFIKSPDGKQHQLKVGDVVYEKDIIITAPGAQVELAFDSGHNYLVRQNETVTLDASVFAPSQSEIANAALLPADANQQNIVRAVIGGDSLDQLLEETAAGLGGGEASDGNSFVRVGRIAENVTPVSAVAVTSSSSTTQAAQEPISVAASPTPVVVSVSSASSSEGASQDFVVALSAPSPQPIQLNLSVSSGSAIVGLDTGAQFISFNGGQTFVAFNGGSVEVPAGVSSVIVRVNSVIDGLIEGNETFSLLASTSSNTTVVSGSGSIVDSPAPVLSISGPIEVNEAAGVATFTVTLNSSSPVSVSVNYATANGSAVAGSDFTPIVGNIVFAPGETSKTISVPITADRIFEGLENFTVNLSNPNNAVIGGGNASVNIRDDALVVSSISSPTVNEGNALVFDVTLSGVSSTSTEVSISTASGSATLGVDTGAQEFSVDGGATWRPLGGVVVVPPGVSGFQVRIATLTDSLIEGSETLTLSASTSQNTTPLVGTGTIVDGTVLTVSISGPSDVNEGVGTVSYTISLSGASQVPVSVNYGSSNGTALDGSDYIGTAGSVTFAPGETTKVITVNVVNDSVFEGPENFSVGLSGVVNAAIGNRSVVTTIRDDGTGAGGSDDDRIVVSSISNPSVTEGGNLVFTVTLSGVASVNTPVSVNASSGTAILGVDTTSGQEFSVDGGLNWSPLNGAVIVPVGSSSFQVRVSTTVDGLLEGNETITLSAATAQNASPINGTGTIIDGAVPTLSISGPSSVNESAGVVSYTISLSSANTVPVSVSYSTNNGTALAGSDYALSAGTVTFAPGETSKVITISIIDDLVIENSETFQVSLSSATNATIGTASVTTSIVDNDFPSVTASQVTVNEFALASGSNPGSTTEAASGTMTVNAPNGVVSMNFGGTVVSLAQLNAATVGAPITINTGEGTLSITGFTAATGVLNYTYSISAAQNVAGASVLDSLNITVTDGASITSATTTFQATIVDDAPTANNDSGTTSLNTAFNGNLSTNDVRGADSTGATWVIATNAANGTVVINASTGTYTYTPNAGYVGTDSFTYTLTDGDGDTSTATVNMNVNSLGTPVVTIVDNNGAVAGQVTVNEFALASGSNPGSTTEAASGTMTVNAPNGVVSMNFGGTVVSLAQLNAATVGAPITINTGEGTLSITGFTAATGVLNYTYSISAAQNVAGASVLDSLNITVTDGASITSATTTFQATIVDDAPTANNDSGTTSLNTAFNGNLSTNDVRGADSTGATWVIATNAANGTVVINASTGTYTYTPNAGYVGTDSFTYTLTDGDGDTSTATVNMNVVNTPPVSTSSTITITEDAAAVVTGGGSVVSASYRFSWSDFGISDVNGGALSVRPTTAPVEGLLQFFNGATWVSAVGLTITQAQVAAGNLRFVPDVNESGDPSFPTSGIGNLRTSYASFNFQGVDAGGATSTPSTLTVNVRPVADLPTLTVTNVASSTLFSTSWETADTGVAQTVLNVDNTSTSYTASTTLSGWTRIDTPDPFAGGTSAFELWSSGDEITGQNGVATVMNAMAGNGTNWLELNNASGNVQTLGIERSVTTVAGNVYNLSFDYAARNGYVSDFTVMTILVDGVSVASYSNLSPNDSLNWRTINFNFVGTGGAQTIRIITDARQYDANGRGAMIDDIVLTRHQGAIAGNANSGANTRIGLSSYVSGTLVDSDTSETLSYNFSSLPAGSIIITAANPGGITPVGGVVTVPASQLASAQLQLPSATLGSVSLNVTATATEPGVGGSSVTTAAQAINFNILNGGTGGTKYVVSSGDTPVLIGGTGNNGTISGFNQITNFNTAQHKLDLNVTPFSAANTAGTNGTDSTLTIGGTTVRSHAISNGMITFDDANTFATALTLSSTANVAAVVQYLRANDLGNAGATVAFTASIGGTAHTYIYQQVGNTPNATNDILIDLVNVTLTSGGTSLTSLISSSVIDPLIIDLGTKGIALSQLGDGVQFDINADGKLDQIAWTQGEDGILAFDFNGDGVINNGSEIFSPYFGGGSYASSIAALTTLDSNGDGVIDAKDATFGKLLVWQDINHDGISNAGELAGLTVHGITSISLGAHQYVAEMNDAMNGQTILSQGSYTKIDGSQGQFVEVNFDAAIGRSSQTADGHVVEAKETANASQEHSLVGSADGDVFKWSLDDGGIAAGPSVDTLMQTDIASAKEGGDILDLRDLLAGGAHSGNLVGNLSNYMHFEYVGGDTVVHVSTEGGFASGYTPQHENQTMIMQGVNLMNGFSSDQAIIQDLLSRGKLVVD
jgi:hypothetical protein